jgi:hypothetical protein
MCARPAPDAAGCTATAPRKRGRSKPDGRTSSAKRYAALVAAFTDQIGGPLTEAERGLVEQAALLQLRCEQLRNDAIAGRPVDDDLIVKLAGASRRALTKITAKAKPATGENLAQYVARKAAEAAALQSDDDDTED